MPSLKVTREFRNGSEKSIKISMPCNVMVVVISRNGIPSRTIFPAPVGGSVNHGRIQEYVIISVANTTRVAAVERSSDAAFDDVIKG